MANKKKQFSNDFKIDAVKYYNESQLSLEEVAKKLSIALSALHCWLRTLLLYSNEVQFTGSGKRKDSKDSELLNLKKNFVTI